VDVVRGGAQDYLVKGEFNVDTLLRTMRYAIERVQGEQLKRQLLQADRLAAIGRLAAGVAHEISNPATFVQASPTWSSGSSHASSGRWVSSRRRRSLARPRGARRAREATAELRRLADQNAAGVDRICAVVQDLRGYARLEPAKVRLIHPTTWSTTSATWWPTWSATAPSSPRISAPCRPWPYRAGGWTRS
jgi:signal transduction histidine kinase